MDRREWIDLRPEQRVTHYNRGRRDGMEAILEKWDKDLREAYSLDPYFNQAQMEPHVTPGLCDCNTCRGFYGLRRIRPKEVLRKE